MTNFLPLSLVFRTGITLAAIVLLALMSLIISIVLANRLESDAEVIGIAGSLRMQAYHIGLLIDEHDSIATNAVATFEQQINSTVLQQAVDHSENEKLMAAFAAVQSHWLENMRPLLQSKPIARSAYLNRVNEFVTVTDQFVNILKHSRKERIMALRVTQSFIIFLTLVLVLSAMYGLRADVISPLYALVSAARAAGRGDFSQRVQHTAEDELGVLGTAFNKMADNIARSYSELEDRVRQKTAELQRSNDALDMLYRMSRLLADSGNIQTCLPSVLEMLASTLDVRSSFFSMAGKGGDFRIVIPEGEFSSSAIPPDMPIPGIPDDGQKIPHVLVFPVETHSTLFGQINIESKSSELDPFSMQIMRSVAEILATALSLTVTEQSQRRILLMEERAVIARELHDSLAQSLSYQKIQVSRLDSLLARGASTAEIKNILDDLRDGLNNAYRQLRELLTTFRLRIDAKGLDAALSITVDEFRERGLDVNLDYRLQHCPLVASEEIHILHAVREALSNVSRHANAAHASVTLKQLADGHVEIVIADDGIGMPVNPDKQQHHGLAIIRERAVTLGGTAEWTAAQPHGTHVTLNFRPAYLNT